MGRTTVATRTIARLLVVGVLAATLVVTLAGASFSQAGDSTYAAAENLFVAKINAERARAGLGSLSVDLQLTGVARNWSDQMAAAAKMSHNPQLAGQVQGDWTRLGENVGHSTYAGLSPAQFVERLHSAFMNSPGHKANVMGDFNQVGVGVRMTSAQMWVTVNFTKARTVVANGTVTEAADVADRVFAAAGQDGRRASYAVVTSSANPAHAMGGAALAGDQAPLLYTHPATAWEPDPVLHPTARAEIDRVLGGEGLVYVVGGTAGVSERAVRELLADGYAVKRLAAPGTEQTLVRVAEETVRLHGNSGQVVIGSKSQWGSNVAAAVWAAGSGTPFLVTSRTSLHDSVKSFLDRHRPARRWVVGPSSSVSASVVSAAGARRVGGADSAAVSVNVAKVLWKRTAASDGDRWASVPGDNSRGWAYTLAYAPWSAVNDGPALLVRAASVPASVSGYLSGLDYGSGVQGSVQAASPVTQPVVNRVETLVAAE